MLTRKTTAAVSAVLLLGAGACLAADDLPKAETILDKYVEATGGKAAYAKRHSEMASGTMELVGRGIKGKLTMYHAEPALSYSEITIEGLGKIEEGSDGKVAWSLSAVQGPHLKEGEERADALLSAHIDSEVRWRDYYSKVETTGMESVEGKDCYKVVLTPKEGTPTTRFYEKDSGLMVKEARTVKTPMAEIQAESVVSDYRKEGDILVPHKIKSNAMGVDMLMTIDAVQYNPEIPKDKFEMPEQIRALVKK